MAKKSNLTKYAGNLKNLIEYIPAKDVLSVFSNLTDAYKENLKTQFEIKRIDTKKELLIKEMDQKYDLYYKIFGALFAERRESIDKSFEIIDKGLKENDKELISTGLGALSQIVSSSPFSNLSELSNLLESGGTIEI